MSGRDLLPGQCVNQALLRLFAGPHGELVDGERLASTRSARHNHEGLCPVQTYPESDRVGLRIMAPLFLLQYPHKRNARAREDPAVEADVNGLGRDVAGRLLDS